MAVYLIGTQCLLDIARKNDKAAHRWFQARENEGLHLGPRGTVFISAMSVAAIRHHIQRAPPASVAEQNLRANIEQLIESFEIADSVVGVDPRTVRFWTDRLGAGVSGIGFEEQLVLATAATGIGGQECVLVDRALPPHEQLGIRVHAP